MTEDRLRTWHGDTPPADLHENYVGSDGRTIPPWLVPIVVVDPSDIPSAVKVSRQGDPGTTPKLSRFDRPRFLAATATGSAEGPPTSGS